MTSVKKVVGFDCDWPDCPEGAIGHRRVTIGKEKGKMPAPRLLDYCPKHLQVLDELSRHITHVGRVP